jgi:hypothetical protein
MFSRLMTDKFDNGDVTACRYLSDPNAAVAWSRDSVRARNVLDSRDCGLQGAQGLQRERLGQTQMLGHALGRQRHVAAQNGFR